MAAGERFGDGLHADGAEASRDLRDSSERTDRVQVPDQSGHAGGLSRRPCASAAGDLPRDQAAGGSGVKGQKSLSPLLAQAEEGGS